MSKDWRPNRPEGHEIAVESNGSNILMAAFGMLIVVIICGALGCVAIAIP